MNVVKEIAETDGMLAAGGHEHYFSVGKSALNVIQATLALAGVNSPNAILDFGCGAGRVTRWLRAAFPDAKISACDTREEDLKFVRRTFDADTWVSAKDVAALNKLSAFDLIWVGSVLTHLDEKTSERLLRNLFGWLNLGGLVVVSLHGRTARYYGDSVRIKYIVRGWSDITRQYDAKGYGYADYPGQRGYGISLSSPAWMMDVAKRIEGSRIVLFGEALWDNHHDVIALQAVQTGG
jgi:2-polyprenyl-3-methyl-5-hydroxy-6-metoxy-1,4-benzoquinol methylase